jgi:hypothetical protein
MIAMRRDDVADLNGRARAIMLARYGLRTTFTHSSCLFLNVS